MRRFKAKKKGTGKKSVPGHISAQERGPEVLELDITKEDNEMLKEPEKTTAGPSGQAVEKERGRRKKKESVPAPQKPDGNRKRSRRSSPRYKWIKFYHEENTKAAREAKGDRTSHQLLVHGLPKTFLGPTQAGPQEKTLNDLMAGLSKETLGEDGVDIIQDNIIGAHPIESSPGEKTPVTRLTLDSRDTKASIRRAAKRADRWGNGTHSVFFRDIPPKKRKRSSSNEDTKTPKQGKQDETPRSTRKSETPSGRRLAPYPRTESRGEEKARTVTQAQKEKDDAARLMIKIQQEQLEARIAKREHQEREEKEAQEKMNRQYNAGPSQTRHAEPIQAFRAINEDNMPEPEPSRTPDYDPEDPEESDRPGGSETEESIEVFPKNESEEIELPDSESEVEFLRGEEQEYESELEYEPSEDEDFQEQSPSPSPEREVLFTPSRSTSGMANRNWRRRQKKKIQRKQELMQHKQKKTMHISERLV